MQLKQNSFFESITETKGVVAMSMLVLFLLAAFLLAQTIKTVKESGYVGYDVSTSNSITVSGIGEVKANPDAATFTFSAQADGTTQESAQTAMATKANAAIEYLKSRGVSEKDIQTADYSVSQKYDTVTGASDNNVSSCPANVPCAPLTSRQVASGFTASESVNVTLHDLSNSGELLRTVADKGATNISSLSFTIADQTNLASQAREKAIDNAKSAAEKLSRQLGVRLVSIESFSENSGGGPVPYFKSAMMDSVASNPVMPQIQTGQNTITSNVTITYKIK